MSENLTDPNKAAHEIINVRADGYAVRNDGLVLQPANKNPWYVLATIYGEHEENDTYVTYNRELAAKNRRAWNLWVCVGLSDEEYADRANKVGLKVADLTPLPDSKMAKAELEEITALFQRRMGKDAILPPVDEGVTLMKTVFMKYVCFRKMVFEKEAHFNYAVFTKEASFTSAVFADEAGFIYATFMGDAYFNFTTFSGSVIFNFSKFMSFTSFGSAKFSGIADFSSSVFQSTTWFTRAQFLTYVPEFHAVELYEDTVFTLPDNYRKNWPPLKGEGIMSAADQKRAYNRLRLFMTRSLLIDEEQFFHRMEMRCKRETEGWQYRWIYTLFEGVSDYGNSVLRPAGWLFVVWLSGVWAKLGAVSGSLWPDWYSMPSAMGWSFANLFSFLGFYRRYFKDEDLSGMLDMFSGVQTVLGFALLFMLGLGLRNRFRLR